MGKGRKVFALKTIWYYVSKPKRELSLQPLATIGSRNCKKKYHILSFLELAQVLTSKSFSSFTAHRKIS